MKLKGLICNVAMLLCMLGFFGAFERVKVYAEEWNAIEYTEYGKTNNVVVDDKVIYKVSPKETGVYSIAIKSYDDNSFPYADVYGTLYNNDKKYIGCVIEQHSSAEYSGNLFYLVSGKTYYVVLEKSAKSTLTNSSIKISFYKKQLLDEMSEVKVGVGSDVLPISEANIKGLTYDEKTHTLEIKNYTGGDEIKIISPYDFEADEKDVPSFPNFNIKISGANTFEPQKLASNFIEISGHGNFNIIGDGTLNAKFKGLDQPESEYVYNVVIAGKGCNIIYDGPTIVVEKTYVPVIVTSLSSTEIIGKITIKSGAIIVNDFVNRDVSYFFAVISAGAIDMLGGTISVNYDRKSDAFSTRIYETIVSPGNMDVTGGNIIITGDEEVLKKLNPIYAGCGITDGIKKALIVGNSIDVSKLDVRLEKDVYEYDGKAKTPKVKIYGFTEGEDYTVSYSNNVNIGTAKVTVKGTGRLTGSKEVTFQIVEGKDDKGSVDGINGPKVSSEITDGKLIYKVTKAGSLDGKTVGKVTVVGLKKKSLKKVTIKSVIKVNGVKYKVTAIGKKAFKNGKKLKSIVIGKNVSKIGKGAFAGCKKLKSIKIKSKKIKKFVKGTFKGVKKTCVIKVPKAKKKVYAKKIKKVGFKGEVK